MSDRIFEPIYSDGSIYSVFLDTKALLTVVMHYLTGGGIEHQFFAEIKMEDGSVVFESVQDLPNFRKHYMLGHRLAILAVKAFEPIVDFTTK